MDRWMKLGSTVFACLAAGLLGVAAVAVPGQAALADSGAPAAFGCPNGKDSDCSINNGKPDSCPGLLCSQPDKACDCVYANNLCKCPR